MVWGAGEWNTPIMLTVRPERSCRNSVTLCVMLVTEMESFLYTSQFIDA